MRRNILGLVALALSCTVTEIEPAGKAPPAPAAHKQPEGKQPEAKRVEPEPAKQDAKQAANKDPKPPEAPKEGAVTARVVEAEAAGVKLLEGGAEPKEALRLKLNKGAKQTLELKMGMHMEMDIAVQKIDPKTLPEIRVKLETKVESTSPLRYSFVVLGAERDEDPSLSNRLLEAVDKAVDGLAGKKGTAQLNDQGITKKIEFEMPELAHSGLRPTLQGFQQAFSQFFVVFPAEPVGVGGKWRAVTHFEQSEIPTQQIATYTLKKRDGEKLEIEIAFEQAATGEKTKKDVPGAEISVEEFGAEGSGKIALRLTDIAPHVAEATTKSAIKSKVEFGGGGSQAVGMTLDLKLSLRDIAAN